MAYRCRECGFQSPKWLGRCPRCGTWDSFEEISEVSPQAEEDGQGWIGARARALPEVEHLPHERLSCGLSEVDRLLGGGLIPGSVILFGGEPGIGKSTLLLQIAGELAARYGRVLYVSGEEAPAQVKLRAKRLGIDEPNLYLLSEQYLLRIGEVIK
ncbi:MAG TPA: DNA repair protein RadA, partial [Candidatus Acetothermia bacterium]|nr:DNA repair protein RadA [Candidatus Acetothermia bacterium]